MNGNGTIHQCLFCEKSFSSVLKLESHMNVHTREKPYFCSYCDDSFSSNNVRWVHEKIHLGTPQYKCDLCEKMFTSPSTLYSHRKRDHKGIGPGGATGASNTPKDAKQQKFTKNKTAATRKPKKKKFISKSTNNNNDLNLSGLTKTNRKEETKTTPTDNQQIIPITVTEFYSAANPATINKPVSTFNNNHNEATPNLSDNQAKTSTTRTKEESQSQREQNSFSCNSCSKSFATGSALNLHVMRKHGSIEERRYRCEPCDKAYCTMAELNRHNVRIHKDKFVNFSPSVTSSSISSSHPPKNGKLSTTTATGKKGEKISKKKKSSGGSNQKIAENSPNTCQFCNESFNSQRRLKLHMTVEHGQKTVNSYKCEQCEKGFYSADQLKSHVCIYQRPKQWNNGFQSQSPDANIIKIQNVTMGSVLDRQLLHMICE